MNIMAKRTSRKRMGLVGKIGAGLLAMIPSGVAGVVEVMPSEARAGYIQESSGFVGINAPSVRLYHINGATDGYDSTRDVIYPSTTPPIVDFYSEIPDYKLSQDKRGLDSMSTYHTKMQGNLLSGYPINGNLRFVISDPNNDFDSLLIFADIYKNSVIDTENINVRNYVVNSTLTPLTLNSNEDIYNIDVKFFNPIPGDINSDGYVDDKDASILGSQWLATPPVKGSVPYSADINNDGFIDDKDAAILAAHYNQSCFSSESSGVPEPGTLTMLAGLGITGAGYLGLRRKG
jgi:hypothetical protein